MPSDFNDGLPFSLLVEIQPDEGGDGNDGSSEDTHDGDDDFDVH